MAIVFVLKNFQLARRHDPHLGLPQQCSAGEVFAHSDLHLHFEFLIPQHRRSLLRRARLPPPARGRRQPPAAVAAHCLTQRLNLHG